MRALRIVLVALALVLASLALVPSLTAAQPPSVASCGEAREPDGGGWVLLLAGRNLNAVKSVGVATDAGAAIGDATIVVRSKTLLVVRIPAVIARPAYAVPGDYRLDLRTSRQVVPVAVHLLLGAQDPGTVDAAALDTALRADLDDAAKLEGQAATHYTSASTLSAGTLSTDLYSAIDDLLSEGRIGPGAAQVAQGDHGHDARYVQPGQLAAGSGLVLNGTTYSLDLGGTGAATSVARSDHDHDTLYPKHSALSAPGAVNDPSNPLEWTRLKNVPAGFADGVDSDTTYSAGTGLSLSSGAFGVNFGGTGSATTSARSNHDHTGTYLRLAGGDTMTGKLSVSSDDGVLLGGRYFWGTIPATGSGTRFMWYPRKAALRAGNVSTGQTTWDDASVGGYSVAFGSDTTASGTGSVAFGLSATATGWVSMATGASTSATGDYSTAMGESSTASGNFSTATGHGTTASGGYSTAMGIDTTAGASASTAMGYHSTASGDVSAAAGYNTTAQAYASLAIGRFNVVSGYYGGWISSDPLFVAGNGASASATANALTLLKNGNLTIAGTLTQNSDERLKKDVAPLADVLKRLAGVRGVTYEFKDQDRNPAGRHVGLLAQEVRKAFPELVSEDASGQLSVAYGNFAAVLLEAVKEQQREIEARDRELADLRERLARIERLLGAAAAEDTK